MEKTVTHMLFLVNASNAYKINIQEAVRRHRNADTNFLSRMAV